MPMSPHTSRANLYLSLGCIAFALVVMFFWAQFDSGSGLILKVRRQVTIGDALAPTAAAVVIGLGGILLWLQRDAESQPRLTYGNAAFLVRFLLILAAGFALMRWAGPVTVWAVNVFGDGDLTYRTLRGTAPWKYIGFFCGGTFLIAALIASTARRLSLRSIVIAALAIMALIALYDLPFDDLQLPPNGDV